MAKSRYHRQKAKREEYLDVIVKKVSTRLEGSQKELTRLHSTNRLLAGGGLKSRLVRRLFSGWARKLRGNGRICTLKIAGLAVAQLRAHFGLEPLEDKEHAKAEIHRFHVLLKLARKRGLKARKAAMDNLETQPLDGAEVWVLKLRLWFQAHPVPAAEEAEF